MFVLRRVTSEGNEMNDCLGERYHKVMQETQKEEFERALKVLDWKLDGIQAQELYGFIIYWTSDQMIHSPLYRKSMYFIMTESGKTFDNITYK